MIATYGNGVVAAFGVGGQVLSFGVMVIVGIGIGLSSLIGHNVGAQKIDRALKTGNQAIGLSLGIMLFFGAIVFVFAEYFIGMFFETPETIGYGVSILRIFALAFPAIGVYIMIEEIHMGVGLNAPMMVFSMINGWGLRVLPVFLAITYWHTGPEVVWWIMSLSLILTAAMVYIYYRRGRWLTVKV
jgi:MATE family, multidrug efflux pump